MSTSTVQGVRETPREAAERLTAVSAQVRAAISAGGRWELSSAELALINRELGPALFRPWMDAREPETPEEVAQLEAERARIWREARMLRQVDPLGGAIERRAPRTFKVG